MTDENQNAEKIRLQLIERYLHLTKVVIPEMARTQRLNLPVQNDHCFQRIVLDNISGGVWYDIIARPAYKHLSVDQAKRAVDLCEAIITGSVNLKELNQHSIARRRKR